VTTSPAQAGRPRDPDVDRRVADAAITLFGETGWAGFSVEAVAKQASVGKASIYLRWPTKEALLVEALRLRVGIIDDVDTGSLREDLIRLARQIVRRGIRRGEIPEGTSITLLLDTLVGGATTHVQTTPKDMRETLRADAARYAEQLVDFLLGAVNLAAVSFAGRSRRLTRS